MIWQKKKKKGTYILSKANVTKFNFVKLLNLDEGNDYSFYYSFNFCSFENFQNGPRTIVIKNPNL